jgi:hypothetical protein
MTNEVFAFIPRARAALIFFAGHILAALSAMWLKHSSAH